MKIAKHTKWLRVSVALLALAVAGDVIFSARLLRVELHQQDYVSKVQLNLITLDSLTSDLLFAQSERVETQWRIVNERLAKALKENEVGIDAQIRERLLQEQLEIERVFSDFVKLRSRPAELPLQHDSYMILIGQLRLRLATIVRIIDFWHRDSIEALERTLTFAGSIIVSVFFVLALLISFWAWAITKSILKPLGMLSRELLAVGAGNFERRMEGVFDNEIGDVARSFDKMAENLRQTSASRNQLDREIVRRAILERELRKANSLLEARSRDLEVANAEWESFSYSVSHDLRAPLRAIEGFSKAAMEDCEQALGEVGRKHLERVRDAALRMNELIESLLQLTRDARSEMIVEKVDLSEMALVVASDLVGAQTQRSVLFEFAPRLFAKGDKVLLRSVLENLIGNAWKYSAQKDVAKIELFLAEERDATCVFAV